jgi:hypothetical protein
VIGTAADIRSIPIAAWPSSRTALVFVEPAFSSNLARLIGETYIFPNACESTTAVPDDVHVLTSRSTSGG